MILYRAEWILPITAPPARRGWVLVDQGRIVARGVEGTTVPRVDAPVRRIDLGAVAIMPGLVNAHTHLELSWMRGMVPPSASMPAWAARLMSLRRGVASEPAAPIADAIREARASGTSLVGDVTNTLAAYDLLADSEIGGAVFRELLGFNAPDPDQAVAQVVAQLHALTPSSRLRASVVPHAPYSVSPALFRAIAAAAGAGAISVHLGESPDEMQFLRDGTGAWRELLGGLGAWNDRWEPPGCGPVEYLERLGVITPHLLAVHGTRLEDHELRRLAASGATLVTCPRSNQWTGAGAPPVDRFYASGVRVAIGTDSLASVEDLNLFAELAAVRRLAPHVPAASVLESATLTGASALGFAGEFGSIDAGKRADLIAVRVPPSVQDVEEYLLTGIEPNTVAWVS